MSNNVICHCIDQTKDVQQSIFKILDTDRDIELKNKYYESTLRLFETNKFDRNDPCHAIILYANGQTLTIGLLDGCLEFFDWVQSGPRIIICDHLDDECPSYKTFLDWSIKNEYDLILAEEEDVKKQVIDSLSAFHWPYMDSKSDEPDKKLMDFESILNRINAYKNLPKDMMNDKLDEIQDLFVNLIDLDEDEEEEEENVTESPEQAEGS